MQLSYALLACSCESAVSQVLATYACSSASCALQRECLQEQAAPSVVEAEAAPLAVMRLTHEEMGVRPVAMIGNWTGLTAAAIQVAPAVTLQPPFNVFEAHAQQQWIMMPAWTAVAHAKHPMAVAVDDCSQLDVLMQQAKVCVDDGIL